MIGMNVSLGRRVSDVGDVLLPHGVPRTVRHLTSLSATNAYRLCESMRLSRHLYIRDTNVDNATLSLSTIMGLSSVLKPLSLGESVALAAILLTGYIIYVYPLRQYRLLFKNVPGPKSTSVFWGNTKELITAPPLEIHEKWMDEYGPSVRYATVMGGTRFATIDPRAVGHVLNDTDTFPKSPIAVRQLGRLLGKGLLVVQHEIHHRQRRILAPAFGPAAIRALDSVVWDKAYLLNKKFMDFLETDDPNVSSAPTGPAEVDKVSGARKVDVEKYLAEMTLDVIGLAGFGYEFECE